MGGGDGPRGGGNGRGSTGEHPRPAPVPLRAEIPTVTGSGSKRVEARSLGPPPPQFPPRLDVGESRVGSGQTLYPLSFSRGIFPACPVPELPLLCTLVCHPRIISFGLFGGPTHYDPRRRNDERTDNGASRKDSGEDVDRNGVVRGTGSHGPSRQVWVRPSRGRTRVRLVLRGDDSPGHSGVSDVGTVSGTP